MVFDGRDIVDTFGGEQSVITPMDFPLPIKHGGDLLSASKKYDIPVDQWIDLSTGVSPWSFPVGDFDQSVWRDLPPSSEPLILLARQYYCAFEHEVVLTPGSQLSIRLLPQLVSKSRVAIPELGYQEHGYSWRLAGHELYFYKSHEALLSLVNNGIVDHAVVITPNNPSCDCLSLNMIEALANSISGLLFVDEAFIDAYQEPVSVSALSVNAANVVVLRSLGKFFGLAGLRIGFVIGAHPLVSQLKAILEPWSVCHASILIAEQALSDVVWQSMQRSRIKRAGHDLSLLLRQLFKSDCDVVFKNTPLFYTVFASKEILVDRHFELARLGVWTRLFNDGDNPSWMRFSLYNDYDFLEKRVKSLLQG